MNNEEKIIFQIHVLTNTLQNDIGLAGLRGQLENNNFDINKILLVTYFESEEKISYGIIVDQFLKVFQFEYSEMNVDGKKHFDLLEITDMDNDYPSWPEISVAINAMKSNTFS